MATSRTGAVIFSTGEAASALVFVVLAVLLVFATLLFEFGGFAAPIAIVSGMSRCATRGVVVKDGGALERLAVAEELIPALEHMRSTLAAKAEAFDGIVKSGRTHLMDATPVRLGQEFAGYAAHVGKGIERVRGAAAELEELAQIGRAHV